MSKYRVAPQEKHGGRLSSASQLERTMACPLSELLPHTALAPPWISKAGKRGTALHKAMEHMGSLKAYEETEEQYHEEIKSIDYSKAVGRFSPFNHREIRFKYDVRTGLAETLPKWEGQKDRDYGVVDPHHVTCTIDVLVAGPTHFSVWDYKSSKDCSRYLPPKSNTQLLFNALCVKKLVCPEAVTCTLGIQQIPSMDVWDDQVFASSLFLWESDVLLPAFAEAEQQAWDFELDNAVTPNPGKYCDLCPGRFECPTGGKKK